MSAVYRPWNTYCIQLDSKSSSDFHRLIQKLVNCYNNHYNNTSVILSSLQTSLVWQHSSLLEGDLNCLEILLKQASNWKYYINIVGSEYPIMSNFELIQRINQVNFINFRCSVVEVFNCLDFKWSWLCWCYSSMAWSPG